MAASGALFGAQERSVRFERIPADLGLSQAFVTCSLQDQQGFMWFGTQEGLNRYDGYEFTLFDHEPADPTTLSNDSVKSLLVDGEGTLWVGTDGGGLSRFHAADGTFTHFRHDPDDPRSLGSDLVRVLYLDPTGVFWVGTDGGGLHRFDRGSGSFERFQHDPEDPASLVDDRIRSLHRDGDGTLWIATEGGGIDALDLETGRFRHHRHDPEDPASLSNDRVRVVYGDRAGDLWVGTYEHGLDRLDRASGGFTHFRHDSDDPASLAANSVRTLLEDRDGTLWIGTDNGLHEWEPQSKTFLRHQNDPVDPSSLSHSTILSLYQDAGGVLWVGTFAGLNKWNALGAGVLHFKHRGDASQLSNSYVTSFEEGPEGTIWVGTHGGGLNHFDRPSRTFGAYRHRPADPTSLSDDRVMALHVDRQGTLWVGTLSGGLNRFDAATETFTRFRNDPRDPASLSHDGVTSIFEDSRGQLWVGTYRGGLNRLHRDTGSVDRFRHEPSDPNSLSNDRVLVLFEDREGNLWVGTDGGGLNRYHRSTGEFSAYRHHPERAESLSSDHIWSITEDGEGNLWLGTQGGGLNRWGAHDRRGRRPVFQRYSKRQGLPSGIVNATVWDERGHLWISTNRGLSRLDPDSGAIANYGSSHGLQSDEFNFGAGFRARDGQLFFGGINGFNCFYADQLRGNRHVPPVALTSFLKFNQPVVFERPLAEVEEIDLQHTDHVIAFEFAALDFAAPERNRYQHRLEGFDEDWVDAGLRRRATYTNLAAGDYVFRVRASNSDGLWNEDGVAVRLHVLPAPWRTWWAYALYTLGLGAVGFLVYRSQSRRLEWAGELDKTNQALKQEIAERLAKEKALHQEKERAKLYFDVVEIIMVALTPGGEVSAINRKGCRVLGYEEAEILGRNWFDGFVAESSRPLARQSVAACRENEYAEYALLSRDGEQRTIAWHTSMLPSEDGSPAGVITSGTDVTEVRQLEQQLYTSQKMDAIGTLAGGIAHDFNNILQSILGYTIITLETLPLDEQAASHLRRVVKAGERAKKLISHILTFSHHSQHEHRPVRIQDVVEEALELLRPSLPTSLEIRKDVDPRCPPVMADPTQIHQVIMNLCTNAYQAMEDGTGLLTISLEEVQVDAKLRALRPKLAEGRHARLTVRDNGVGMDRATLDRIFDPFFSTRRVGTGTGLGLSVVHGIVKGVKGQIFVTSQEGKGTEFQIFIPCSATAAEAEEEAQETPAKGRERILVVDDEEDIVTMERVMLTSMGYDVVACTSATEALDRFLADPDEFDLVVTDQTMPNLTGSRIAEEVKRRRPDLPVILVSGFLGSEAAGGPVDRYLQKPFMSSELGQLVRQLLDQRPAASRERAS